MSIPPRIVLGLAASLSLFAAEGLASWRFVPEPVALKAVFPTVVASGPECLAGVDAGRVVLTANRREGPDYSAQTTVYSRATDSRAFDFVAGPRRFLFNDVRLAVGGVDSPGASYLGFFGLADEDRGSLFSPHGPRNMVVFRIDRYAFALELVHRRDGRNNVLFSEPIRDYGMSFASVTLDLNSERWRVELRGANGRAFTLEGVFEDKIDRAAWTGPFYLALGTRQTVSGANGADRIARLEFGPIQVE